VAGQVAADGLVLDQVEQRILRDACCTADDLAAIEAALETAAVMVKGSMGQPVVNQLYAEARKARALIATLLGRLRLDDPEAAGKGRGSATTSTSARAAAQVRWLGTDAGPGMV
jgi:hypothetical protein